MSETNHYSADPSREIALPESPGLPASRLPYAETIEVEAEVSDTHEFLEYWQILRRRKGAFAFIAFIGSLGGFLLTLPQTPIYQARTSIEITVPNENALNFKDATSIDSLFDYLDNYLQTQIRIIQSDEVRTRTLATLKAKKRTDVWDNPGRLSAWRKALHIPEPTGKSGDPQQAGVMPPNSIQVRLIPNTRIVDVISDSTNPAFAAEYVNTLAAEYIERTLESRSSGSDRTKDWLGRQLSDLKVELEKSEQQLQAYSRASSLIFTSEKDSVTGSQLKTLQDQLSAAHGETIAKQSQYQTVSAAPIELLGQVVENTTLSTAETKLAELNSELRKLNVIYTPAHPKVKELQDKVQELGASIEKERGTTLIRLRTELDSAKLHEKMLAAAFARQTQNVSEEAGKSIQYNFLKREVDTNRELYDTMLQKVKETEIASAMRTSNIRVIDPARPPNSPYKPNLGLNTALGLLSGMFVGLVFIFVLEHADLSLKAPGDAALYLKTAELGVIPLSSARSTKSAYGDDTVASFPTPATNGKRPGSGSEENVGLSGAEQDRPELVTWQHKLSLVAESYRAALTSILLCGGNNGTRPRTLVFTSAGPSEGKTTTVTNLGIALAETNRRVLLIDADMRKPRLHDVFNLPNTWGLTDLLREKGPIEALPREALARETGIPGLFVLTSGPATVSISNLLYSTRTVELLRRFRHEYYAVLIDTPPMMQLADARILGRLADAAVIVVGAGRTTRDAARAAKQRLSADGILVLGAILNRWDPKSASSYGVYGYYDGYYAKKSS
jgi:succinoglycan biosynthesis transport protein ExoP